MSVYLWWLLASFLHFATTQKLPCDGGSKETQQDPRSIYEVQMTDFQLNQSISEEKVVVEITEEKGFSILKGLFSPQDIEHAKETVLFLIAKQGLKATHFQGSEGARADLQARVWNLLNKGEIFEKLVQHPTILGIARRVLGDDMQLGSIASNTIFPGGSGQEPHIDYPYWDYYNKQHWPVPPKHKDIAFHMNMQLLIPLDDLTEENGATSVRPGSQTTVEYPSNIDEYKEHQVQVTAKAGDAVVFVGALQHCAMPNHSQSSRSVILIQMLPKWVRPMEDQKRMLKQQVHDRASEDLRKLLLLDYPYPAVLDEEESGNSEGSRSTFKWK